MSTPLNASASTAGALFSSSTFLVPPFQREYSWEKDEVSDFWSDLRNGLGNDAYFLGLIILTDEGGRKYVVDGQQRLLTLTLLAAALHREAITRGRKALAERIQADFLRSIDYATDAENPRVTLADTADNETLQIILNTGNSPEIGNDIEDSISKRMCKAFDFLKSQLHADLAADPFKRLGIWTEFLTDHVYFAVFVHPDAASAYKVFEIINTRGRELTTADLLKNYVLSQTPQGHREERYQVWQSISRQFSNEGSGSFVQYIRHVVTVQNGYILPKDLYDFLAQRRAQGDKTPPSPDRLTELLQENIELYMQMVDPTLAGPAQPESLKIFAALNSLGVTAVRPILLAIAGVPDPIGGMRSVLTLVVRLLVVGNLGTNNIERRFGEVAKKIHEQRSWRPIEEDFRDVNPPQQDFVTQLSRRSFKKGVLAFIRKSIVANRITPERVGVLHFIMPQNTPPWDGFTEEDAAFWGGTIGNTFLSTADRRPDARDWNGFKQNMLGTGIQGEIVERLRGFDGWTAATVSEIGQQLAEAAGNVWY